MPTSRFTNGFTGEVRPEVFLQGTNLFLQGYFFPCSHLICRP